MENGERTPVFTNRSDADLRYDLVMSRIQSVFMYGGATLAAGWGLLNAYCIAKGLMPTYNDVALGVGTVIGTPFTVGMGKVFGDYAKENASEIAQVLHERKRLRRPS